MCLRFSLFIFYLPRFFRFLPSAKGRTEAHCSFLLSKKKEKLVFLFRNKDWSSGRRTGLLWRNRSSAKEPAGGPAGSSGRSFETGLLWRTGRFLRPVLRDRFLRFSGRPEATSSVLPSSEGRDSLFPYREERRRRQYLGG